MSNPAATPAGYERDGACLVRYELAFTPAEGTATIVRNLYAGVSGPSSTFPAADREQAAAGAFAAGLLVTGDWEETPLGGFWAPCSRMN